MKIKHDGQIIGTIVTDRNMSVQEALDLVGIDPNQQQDGEFLYDYDLITLDYSK